MSRLTTSIHHANPPGPEIESPLPVPPVDMPRHKKSPQKKPRKFRIRRRGEVGGEGGLTLDEFVGALDGVGLEDPLGRPRLGHGARRAASATARCGSGDRGAGGS